MIPECDSISAVDSRDPGTQLPSYNGERGYLEGGFHLYYLASCGGPAGRQEGRKAGRQEGRKDPICRCLQQKYYSCRMVKLYHFVIFLRMEYAFREETKKD